jgi:hypothetical protein
LPRTWSVVAVNKGGNKNENVIVVVIKVIVKVIVKNQGESGEIVNPTAVCVVR